MKHYQLELEKLSIIISPTWQCKQKPMCQTQSSCLFLHAYNVNWNLQAKEWCPSLPTLDNLENYILDYLLLPVAETLLRIHEITEQKRLFTFWRQVTVEVCIMNSQGHGQSRSWHDDQLSTTLVNLFSRQDVCSRCNVYYE